MPSYHRLMLEWSSVKRSKIHGQNCPAWTLLYYWARSSSRSGIRAMAWPLFAQGPPRERQLETTYGKYYEIDPCGFIYIIASYSFRYIFYRRPIFTTLYHTISVCMDKFWCFCTCTVPKLRGPMTHVIQNRHYSVN